MDDKKPNFDFGELISGSYEKTIEVSDGITITVKIPTLNERLAASEKRDYETGSRSMRAADRGLILTKHLAPFMLKSTSVKGKEFKYSKTEEWDGWLGNLPDPLAENILGSISRFIEFYNKKTSEEWKSDPFMMEGSTPSPASDLKE